MARPLRIDPEGGWHHVMNRGVNRRDIFVDDVDRTEFLRLLGLAVERHDIELHAYCLMSNHFHLLVRCPEGGVSQLTQWLTSRYATWFNDRHGRVGHLFGGRFTSRLVDSEANCLNAIRYIHRNPLDLPTVATAADHRWSSHRAYLRLRRPRGGSAPNESSDGSRGSTTSPTSSTGRSTTHRSSGRPSLRRRCSAWSMRCWPSTQPRAVAR